MLQKMPKQYVNERIWSDYSDQNNLVQVWQNQRSGDFTVEGYHGSQLMAEMVVPTMRFDERDRGLAYPMAQHIARELLKSLDSWYKAVNTGVL